jgi:hypothetical protein
MLNPTWAEIRDKVRRDLDLQDEVFIDDDELLSYANEAINVAEAMIHTLYEDYFLVRTTLPLVAAANLIALPADIYADKIRALIYDDGNPSSRKYLVRRVRDLPLASAIQAEEDYRYVMTNTDGVGPRIRLYPASRETNSNLVCWYLRNAKRLVNLADTSDIPEWAEYIYQYMKARCMEKEGDPRAIEARRDLGVLGKTMEDTLRDRVPDEDNQIRMDLSHYMDFDQSIYNGGGY